MLKVIMFVLAMFLPFGAYAEEKEGIDKLPAQPKCDISGYVATKGAYIEKKRIAPIGQVVNKGDTLFYIGLVQAKRYIIIPQDGVDLRDPSPLNVSGKFEAGQKYLIEGTFVVNKTISFDIVHANFGLFSQALVPVRQDGFFCSNKLTATNGGIADSGMPTIHQATPAKFQSEEVSGGWVKSIAIVVKEIDAATVTLDITAMNNGARYAQKQSTFDLMAGSIDLGDLAFELTKEGQGARMVAIKEPLNWMIWINQMFPASHRK